MEKKDRRLKRWMHTLILEHLHPEKLIPLVIDCLINLFIVFSLVN